MTGASAPSAGIPLDSIIVGADRHRRDLGDVASLARSIASVGLLHPVVVDDRRVLVAGERRLAAARSLGWTEIPARIVDLSPLGRLLAERDENTERKAFLPSEAVAIASALDERERELSAEAQASTRYRADDGGANLAPPLRVGDTRDRVAPATGLGRSTLAKATEVVQAAQADPKAFGDLVERMDRTGRVDGAFIELHRRRQAAEVARRSLGPPTGRWDVIVADPPWRYDDAPAERGLRGGADYATMSLDELAAMTIPAAADCALWLWITNSGLAEGWHTALLAAWQFRAKTILTWDKRRLGTGHWLRNVTEHCILAVRGSPVVLGDGATTLLSATRGGHSAKPDAFYTLVERICPGRRLEMFARRRRAGWDAHGLEVDAPAER